MDALRNLQMAVQLRRVGSADDIADSEHNVGMDGAMSDADDADLQSHVGEPSTCSSSSDDGDDDTSATQCCLGCRRRRRNCRSFVSPS